MPSLRNPSPVTRRETETKCRRQWKLTSNWRKPRENESLKSVIAEAIKDDFPNLNLEAFSE